MKTLKTIIRILFLLTMGFFLGIEVMIGIFKRHQPQFARSGSPGSQKVETLIKAIDRKYVDAVDMDSIMDRVLPTILQELDPHSAYYPAEETQESNDELHGSFSGIGIQFSIQEDTVRVNSVIHGGPSEKVGAVFGRFRPDPPERERYLLLLLRGRDHTDEDLPAGKSRDGNYAAFRAEEQEAAVFERRAFEAQADQGPVELKNLFFLPREGAKLAPGHRPARAHVADRAAASSP